MRVTAEEIEINGPFLGEFSGLFTSGETGNGGNLTIDTRHLRVLDGGVIAADTFNTGKAGNLDIRALERLELLGESSLTAEAFGGSDAGNLNIDTGQMTVANGARITVGSFQGQAGNLNINTGQMTVANDARVSVASLQGQAGNLQITADSLSVSQGGIISAITGETSTQSGGNINLQIANNLSLSSESSITASARGDANGGNIDIDTEFLIAFPPEGSNGSDIIARAPQGGQGGRIDIATQGIFGIESRENLTPFNDITASSKFGLSGVVEIDTPDIDPSQDSLDISVKPIEVEVAQTCQPSTSGNRSEFAVVGRGGLSDSPTNTLDTAAGWEDWGVDRQPEHERQLDRDDLQERENSSPSQTNTPIVEAQSWRINDRGNVVLVAGSAPESIGNGYSCQQNRSMSNSQ